MTPFSIDPGAPAGYITGVMFSWDNIWVIVSKPDNIPILMMIIGIAFFVGLGLREAFANDRLVQEGRKGDILRRMQE